MVTRRRDEVTKQRDEVTRQINAFIVPGLIEEFEIVDRPTTGTRTKYQIDPHVRAILDLVEQGKAVRVKINEHVPANNLFCSFRNAIKKQDFDYHYKRIDDQTLLMWAEKVKGTAK
jgi:hypothetical protein